MDTEFKNLILISGNEEYLKDQKKKELLGAVDAKDSLNFNTFSDENLDLIEIRRLLETAPFFEKYRKILINDSGLFEKNAANIELAVGIFNDVPESSVIIFCEKNVSTANPLYKIIKKKGAIFNYENVESLRGSAREKSKTQIRNWVRDRLKSEKRNIDGRTLYEFLELCGYDMQNLSTELEKLISYTMKQSPGYTITGEDVNSICSRTLSDKVFSMMDMKFKGDILGAIRALEELFGLKIPAIKTLILLEKQYYQALSLRACMDAKTSDSEICQQMDIKDWQLRRMKQQIRDLSYDEILRRLEECVSMDYKIKTGNMPDRLALEILILN